MTNKPLISIVVPCFNHEHFLRERLDSIFSQTYSNFEVILLDDASTDNSAAILKQVANNETRVAHCIINEKNSGSPFIQWKKGVELARADFIWIAESDDYAAPEFLEILIQPLSQNDSIGLAYCQSWRINNKSEVRGTMRDWTADLSADRWESEFIGNGIEEIAQYLVKKNSIPNASAVLFKKKMFPFNLPIHSFKQSGDVLVWSSIIRAHDVYFTPEHLNFFRHHPQTVRHGLNYSIKLRDNLDYLATVAEWGVDQKQIAIGLKYRLKDIALRLYQDYLFTENLPVLFKQWRRFKVNIQFFLLIYIMKEWMHHLAWLSWQKIKKIRRTDI